MPGGNGNPNTHVSQRHQLHTLSSAPLVHTGPHASLNAFTSSYMASQSCLRAWLREMTMSISDWVIQTHTKAGELRDCQQCHQTMPPNTSTHSAISNSSSDLIQFLWQRHLTSREASCHRCHRDATTLYERSRKPMHWLATAQAWEWGGSGRVPLVQQRHQRREMGTHRQHHSECSSSVHQGAPTCRCELAKGGSGQHNAA